ncbi:transmembrane protein 26b [Chiloscyllium plagiosum]|uniref:transmembrane protein 26b n=1 Tax=Chiloscyllium plagiosum TaxID=36176 RepID=UPI001CB7D1DD|nr:transmembrane protein 26b [Chiloscyllium plagiosum]
MVLTVYLSAVVPRLIFVLHTVLAVWRVTLVKNDPIYWLLLLLILLTLVEMTVTLTIQKGKDYSGFSPALFFYLINIIPPVWMLELYQLDKRIHSEECRSMNSSMKCTHFVQSTEAPTIRLRNSSNTINVVIDFLNSTLDWTLGFHQTLMILLIVGKWILPMGAGVRRDQLSQLLLTFVGIAADILEFKSETLSEKGVRCHPELVYAILALWTWSMLQFPLDLTVLQKTEESHPHEDKPTKNVHKHSADLWNITISIFIQDGPFFIFRLFLMFHKEIVHQMLLFFTIKNALVLTLQIYRLALIYLEMRQSNGRQQLTPPEDNVPTCNTEMGDIAE